MGRSILGILHDCLNRRRSRGPRPRFVPRLEDLETRALPSTFTVTNLDDSGPGSLRQAVLDANAAKGANEIDFAHRIRGVIALQSGQLDITGDVIVDGPGADQLAISGQHASRVFNIGGGA